MTVALFVFDFKKRLGGEGAFLIGTGTGRGTTIMHTTKTSSGKMGRQTCDLAILRSSSCSCCLYPLHPHRRRWPHKLHGVRVLVSASSVCAACGLYRMRIGALRPAHSPLDLFQVQLQQLADLSAEYHRPVTVLLGGMVAVGKNKTLMLDGATLCERKRTQLRTLHFYLVSQVQIVESSTGHPGGTPSATNRKPHKNHQTRTKNHQTPTKKNKDCTFSAVSPTCPQRAQHRHECIGGMLTALT